MKYKVGDILIISSAPQKSWEEAGYLNTLAEVKNISNIGYKLYFYHGSDTATYSTDIIHSYFTLAPKTAQILYGNNQ